ncbi:MAG: FtsX-like permease family protein, partial [Bacteroidota bacterium]
VGREKETLEQIETLYAIFNPGFLFDCTFLDDNYQEHYEAEQRASLLSSYFALMAILISCLGLFGLAVFTAERRIKEIGIRKVMGASIFNIVQMLSGEFAKMVGVAVAIALPSSYFLAREWLDGFTYRIGLEWWYFAGAGLITLLIAWLAVSLQTMKAARQNPTELLRSE